MNNSFNTDISNSGFVAQVPLDQHPYFTQIKEIKSFGFNQLYTAERFGKKWLLKGLKTEFRQQPLYIELLKKEFDILMSISYPYIVQAFGVELIPDLGPCIIMEYVDGLTLEELLKRGASTKQKHKIIDQLLEALKYVHQKQIVHRDLKPTNILITHNGGNVKLIDFGLADTDAYRILKQPAGTLHYMSPEQREERQPDIRNDIYSMGRILEDMQLGRSYSKVVRKCLQPLQLRYSDVNQLHEALIQVSKVRSRTIASSIFLIFILFLGYLTWQIQVIQQRIPALPVHKGTMLTPKSAQIPDHEMSSKKQYGPVLSSADSVHLEAAIVEGITLLDDYLDSTGFDEYIRGIHSLTQLDQERYATVAHKASEIIENYMDSVKDTYVFEQRRYIYNRIGQHFVTQYLDKWNAKVEKLATDQTGFFSAFR